MVEIFNMLCKIIHNKNPIRLILGLVGCIALLLLQPTPLSAQEISARGLVKAKSRAVLASEIGAVVSQTPYRAGEAFKKGDVLIGFDCRLLKSQKDKVEAQEKASKAQLINARDLEKMRSIGKLEVTMAKAENDKARAELNIAKLNVERCRIKAPFDGTVVQLLVNQYESIDLRRNLIEIVSSSELEVEVLAPANWLTRVSKGQIAKMQIDELNKSAKVEVLAISGAVDPVSQTVLIRGRIAEKPDGLLPGMSGAFKP
jgi:RND family efflux transporter MFP subunit